MVGIAPGRLHRFTVSVCTALGSSDDEAVLVADQLVRANQCGHDSHGVGMLPTYVRCAKAGLLRVGVDPVTVVDNGPVVVIDGQHGFGQVMGHRAMRSGIDRAAEHGVALVGLRNSFHIGRIGHWGEQATAAGMASIHFVNVAAHEPLVAPFAGSSARFGTNPVCIAVPGSEPGEPAVLLDMATSTIALGKTRVALNRGESVPVGSVLDADGRPSTDPGVMWNEERPGALVAMGDHKGSGLALMCELLGAALLGGTTIDPSNERTGAIINSMLSIVIDPNAVGDRDNLAFEAERFLAYVKGSAVRDGFEEVLVPGEPEARARAARDREIDIDPTTCEQLDEAAALAGAPPLAHEA